MFDSPEADPNDPQRVMLYLHTKSGPVLFEMAAHVEGTFIILSGRQIESDLRVSIDPDERLSESWTHARDSEGYAAGCDVYDCDSEISSLTAPSIRSHSTLESGISASSKITTAISESDDEVQAYVLRTNLDAPDAAVARRLASSTQKLEPPNAPSCIPKDPLCKSSGSQGSSSTFSPFGTSVGTTIGSSDGSAARAAASVLAFGGH
jgi:hypothetical protein